MQENNGEEPASVDSTSTREEINVNMMKILYAHQTLGIFFSIFFSCFYFYFLGVFDFSCFFSLFFLGFGLFLGVFNFLKLSFYFILFS